mmetsp:Transcript_7284/g.14371  ORF Transcript_7284/g.14371 Transcript_7284/m.14371 type:complete len:99 (+) Transcript_7284:83-379(+)
MRKSRMALTQATVTSSSSTNEQTQSDPNVIETITLRLVPRRVKKKSVKWTEDVEEVNEFSGKKKSKKCCIFHKRRVFGDWSDDDSDEDCECVNDDKEK